MSEVLQASKRSVTGSSACRRLRSEGRIPAVLYGHGEATEHLTVSSSELTAALRHGAKLIEIAGDFKESALLRDIQWDALGIEILHVDLARVSATEAVEVEIRVELRGDAPGLKEGGVVEHPTHTVTIRCPAGAIPEKFEVNINELHLGDAITADQIELPEKATLVSSSDALIAHCVEVTVEEVEEETVLGAEPEVIGRKPEDEEDE